MNCSQEFNRPRAVSYHVKHRSLFYHLTCLENLPSIKRAGKGRRPWASTISSSGPHISFFLFRQPWATTISYSVPPHLTLPGKNIFLMIYLGPLKLLLKNPAATHNTYIFKSLYFGLNMKLGWFFFCANLNSDFHIF